MKKELNYPKNEIEERRQEIYKRVNDDALDLLQWELVWKDTSPMHIPFGLLAKHGHKLESDK